MYKSSTHAQIRAFTRNVLETHNITFFVIALVLNTDTQRATAQHQLFASSKKKWLKNLNHTKHSISITVHLSLVHVTRLYWKIFKRFPQTITEAKGVTILEINQALTDCHVHYI